MEYFLCWFQTKREPCKILKCTSDFALCPLDVTTRFRASCLVDSYFLLYPHLEQEPHWGTILARMDSKDGERNGTYPYGTCSRFIFMLICCFSVAQLCLTLCNPMDCSTPGFPVFHHLPELAPTHVHQVGEAIQPSCPLSVSSSPAFNLSQHQGLKNQLLASGGQNIGALTSASCWLYHANHRKRILVKLGSGIFDEFARANIIGYIWGN